MPEQQHKTTGQQSGGQHSGSQQQSGQHSGAQQSGGQHRCPKCNQTFNSAEEQRRHEQEHHKQEGSTSEQYKQHAGNR